MRKLTSVLLILALTTVFAALTFAQELKVSGEAKSGIYWQQVQKEGKAIEANEDALKLHNTEDAGPYHGRFRLNLDYDNGDNRGMKAQINWENWGNNQQPLWSYAFGYGNFFEDQMTVAVGKLGASPWGTGEPDMWKELEQYHSGGGMRIEWKPAFVPGSLNVGFVLSWFNEGTSTTRTASFVDLLQESVVGIAYANDLFALRLGYRLDSTYDSKENAKLNGDGEGDEFLYRLEEYKLNELVPGMSVWAVGYYMGLVSTASQYYKNWLFFQYDPPELGSLETPFTFRLRLGYDYVDFYDDEEKEDALKYTPTRNVFHVTPSFYWHFFHKLVSIGALFSYQQDLGADKIWPGSPYESIQVEPKLQLNFASSYIAIAYNWKKQYVLPYTERGTKDPVKQTQFINLRFCIYY